MNYYIPEKKQTVTRSLMDSMGLPEDDATLADLGYFPVEYAYLPFDSWRQGMLPDGEPVRKGAGFVQNFKVVPLDEERLAQSLAKYKDEALARLNDAWQDAEQHGKLESSAGFAIDANERADRDIRGLITAMEANGMETASFCGADNTFHDVTLANLKAMQLEIIAYGQTLYARKWAMRSSIENAADFADVDAVKISFAEA